MSFYNERPSTRIFDRDKMLNPIYKAKVTKIVEDVKNKQKNIKDKK